MTWQQIAPSILRSPLPADPLPAPPPFSLLLVQLLADVCRWLIPPLPFPAHLESLLPSLSGHRHQHRLCCPQRPLWGSLGRIPAPAAFHCHPHKTLVPKPYKSWQGQLCGDSCRQSPHGLTALSGDRFPRGRRGNEMPVCSCSVPASSALIPALRSICTPQASPAPSLEVRAAPLAPKALHFCGSAWGHLAHSCYNLLPCKMPAQLGLPSPPLHAKQG